MASRWRTRLGQTWLPGVSSAREVAMNRIGRPYRAGYAEVVNLASGERWWRRRGSWFRAHRDLTAPELDVLKRHIDEAVHKDSVYAGGRWADG